LPVAVPLWFFILTLGIVLVITIAAHGYIVWKFRGLDKECRVLSLQLAEHKSKMENTDHTMGRLVRAINALIGPQGNGGKTS
jgi:hypothetical protein